MFCHKTYFSKLFVFFSEGVTDFSQEIGTLTDQVHTNHAYLSNATALKKHMSKLIPDLKSSVNTLRTRVDTMVFDNKTPTRSATSVSL